MRQYIKQLFIFLLFSVLINTLLFLTLYNPKRIAVLDMQEIINDYIKSAIDKENNEKDIEQFVMRLNAMVKVISQSNNLIIIPKQVVFSGEDLDVTNEFRRLLDVK
jgi:hypothetical protein